MAGRDSLHRRHLAHRPVAVGDHAVRDRPAPAPDGTGEDLHHALGPVGVLMSEKAPFRILVLCTGNSARSQLAEAIISTRGMKRPMGVVEAASAGTKPAVKVSEYAVQLL